MGKTTVSQMSRGQSHEFLNKLEAAGLNSDLGQKVVDSKENELALKVVHLITNGGYRFSTNQGLARKIMGKNFFGVEEAITHFKVNPSKQQLTYLVEVPFPKEVLESCKDTHILVCVFPISVQDITWEMRDRVSICEPKFETAAARDKGEVGWQLVRKTPIAGSTNKTWDEQQNLLSEDEETPSAQIVVYSAIGHFFVTGEWLFKKVYVRTLLPLGYHIDVGYSDGLVIKDRWVESRLDNVGLSSARKY